MNGVTMHIERDRVEFYSFGKGIYLVWLMGFGFLFGLLEMFDISFPTFYGVVWDILLIYTFFTLVFDLPRNVFLQGLIFGGILVFALFVAEVAFGWRVASVLIDVLIGPTFLYAGETAMR